MKFQFLGRNSGRSDWMPAGTGQLVDMFQFLGRNSGRSDIIRKHTGCREFQFLGRNSGRSDYGNILNERLAIWEFQFLGRNSGRSDPRAAVSAHAEVSIPRSEFWSFGQYTGKHPRDQASFNSSVGILVVRTFEEARGWFQFLGRNSGRSDYPANRSNEIAMFQFLGRNSGRSDMQDCLLATTSGSAWFQFLGRNSGRSDPRNPGRKSRMFQFLGRNSGRSDARHVSAPDAMRRFNSSVGILVVRTCRTAFCHYNSMRTFQFLGRNSGRSDVGRRC